MQVRPLYADQRSWPPTAICLTTGPQSLPRRVLHGLRSSASPFKHSLFSSRSSSSCWHLIPHLPFTSILPSTFPSITCFRRQFLHKMWPIQLVSFLFILFKIFELQSFHILVKIIPPATHSYTIFPGRCKVEDRRTLLLKLLAVTNISSCLTFWHLNYFFKF